MKLLTLDKLDRFYQNLIKSYDPVLNAESDNAIANKAVAAALDELREEFGRMSGVDEELREQIQQALDRIEALGNFKDQIQDSVGDLENSKQETDNKVTEIEKEIEKIEQIIQGNQEAIEDAQNKGNALDQALSDAMQNITNAETELGNVKQDIENIKNGVDGLNTDVAGINDKLVSVDTALNSHASDISQIHADLGALDGLAALQQQVNEIDEVVDALEKQDLTAYVKKETLEDSIKTTVIKLGVIDEQEQVNFYTKTESADQISTALAEYTRNELGNTLSNYYTKEETPEAVKTEMFAAGLVDGEGHANVYTKAETADSISTSLSEYTNNVLSNYSTIAATADAITTAVGNLNLNQYSTVNQTAEAIETAIADFDDNNLKQNYYNKTETAELVTSNVTSYVDGQLTNYSTTAQTATAIQTAIANVSLEGKLEGYSTVEQTAEAIRTAIADNNANYSTTDQTAASIQEAIISNNNNYYTKEATAEQITTAVQAYKTENELNLQKYSTLTQTADSIDMKLISMGYAEKQQVGTDEETGEPIYGGLTRLTLTANEVRSTVNGMAEEPNGLATKSDVYQAKDEITSTVATLQNDVIEQASVISQTNHSIGLVVTNNKLDAEKIISAINLNNTDVRIEGQHITIDGNTEFAKDVKIKGNIDCSGNATIESAGLTIDENGLTITDKNNSKITFNSNGISFSGNGTEDSSFILKSKSGQGIADGEEVLLDWGKQPSSILLTPNSIQTTIAGYTSSDLRLRCYAVPFTNTQNASGKYGFTCRCYITTSEPTYISQNIAAKNLTESRNASDEADVTKTLTSDTITATSGSTATTLSGFIYFHSGYNTNHNDAVSTTGNTLTAPAGATLTINATPTDANQYEIAAEDINVTTSSTTLDSNKKYTVTLGAHDNATVTMSATTDVNWNKAGIRNAVVEVYVNDTLTKSVSYNNNETDSVTGLKLPNTNKLTADLAKDFGTISHAAGATIKVVAKCTWTWKVDSYKIEQGAITCTSNEVGDDLVLKTGTVNYLCLG